MKTASIAQMVVRIAGLVQLVLGIIYWIVKADNMIPVHILIGSLLTIALLVLSYLAFRSGISIGLVILAVVWALGLPAWGLAQANLLPAAGHWIIQVLHLLCGIGAVGMAEMLGAQRRCTRKAPWPRLNRMQLTNVCLVWFLI
jgi:hypothetical protein